MTWYWRFTFDDGEICGPCAWILAYSGMWNVINVHESTRLMIACVRCHRNMWTVASHDLSVIDDHATERAIDIIKGSL